MSSLAALRLAVSSLAMLGIGGALSSPVTSDSGRRLQDGIVASARRPLQRAVAMGGPAAAANHTAAAAADRCLCALTTDDACWTSDGSRRVHQRHPTPDRVVFWKLKKVAGSTLCAVLRAYSQTHNYTISDTFTQMLVGKGGKGSKDPPRAEKLAPLFGLPPPPLPDRLDDGRIMCMHHPKPKWVTQFVHRPTTLQLIVFRKPISMAVSRWYYVIPSYNKKKESVAGRGELSHEDLDGPAPTASTAIRFMRFFLGRLPYQVQCCSESELALQVLAARRLSTAANGGDSISNQQLAAPHHRRAAPYRLPERSL